MPEKDPAPFAAPAVQDRRIKPPGILPKNAQAWALSSVAFVMVLVIALSGKKPPKGRAGAAPAPSAAVDPNAARIEEYRERLEEQTHKLQLEQDELARSRQALGLRASASAASSAVRFLPADAAAEDNSIQMERKKREYQSLFASNMVLSYRPSPASAQGAPTAADALTKAALLTAREEKAGTGPAAPARGNDDGGEGRTGKGRERPSYPGLNHAEGKSYRLFEGTVLETVLTNRLDGYFSGPINCMVTTNVYSHDGQRLLIPQGSRVLGEVRRVETFGQQRLAVFFHRLIMPDGYSVSLDQFHGLNQIGETGLIDQVNHHYLQVFGVSLAIGAIAGLGQVNTTSGLNVSAADAYREGVTASLSQSSLRILDRYLNVLPTITIREGHRVKVYLSDDLPLPDYEKHQMPGDL